MIHQRGRGRGRSEETIFGSPESELTLPKYRVPRYESKSEVILELIRDELFLDGNARQNLATFARPTLTTRSANSWTCASTRTSSTRTSIPSRRRSSPGVSTCWQTSGMPRSPATRWAPPRWAPRRPACWGAWPCTSGGSRHGSRWVNPPTGPTWSPARCRCAGRSLPATGTSSCGRCHGARPPGHHPRGHAALTLDENTIGWSPPGPLLHPAPMSR